MKNRADAVAVSYLISAGDAADTGEGGVFGCGLLVFGCWFLVLGWYVTIIPTTDNQ